MNDPRLWSLVACAALAVSGCGASDAAGASPDPVEAPAPVVSGALVETMTLDSASFRETLDLTGETEPVRTAVLASQVPGRITQLAVERGQTVRAGARVLRIDTSTSDAQRAQLRTQIAALDRDILRSQQLIDRGIGTLTDLERQSTQRQLAVDQLDALEVGIAQGAMSAPIGGVVTEKLAEVGEYANPGVPLARIVDISTIIIRVGLPEREIEFVREGMPVAATIAATGQHVVGTLERIGVQANVANRTFPLEIHIDNSDGALRAGMRARVQIPKREYEDAIVVPRDAVLQGIDGTEVLVVEDGVARLRHVTIGPGRGAFTVALDGLSAGEELIVRGHRLLVPGEQIRTVQLGHCCARQLQEYTGAADAADELTVDSAD